MEYTDKDHQTVPVAGRLFYSHSNTNSLCVAKAANTHVKPRWRIFFTGSGKPYYVEILNGTQTSLHGRVTGRVVGI
jgi:hypothetical protein